MNLINGVDLKAKLERGDDFKLVMVLGDWEFKAKHIPGSLNIFAPEIARKLLDLEDEIVVYCSNLNCPASIADYRMLEGSGHRNVRRYAGGLLDWEDAGYPLEGDMVEEASPH